MSPNAIIRANLFGSGKPIQQNLVRKPKTAKHRTEGGEYDLSTFESQKYVKLDIPGPSENSMTETSRMNIMFTKGALSRKAN
jgi:hypothetical protein